MDQMGKRPQPDIHEITKALRAEHVQLLQQLHAAGIPDETIAYVDEMSERMIRNQHEIYVLALEKQHIDAYNKLLISAMGAAYAVRPIEPLLVKGVAEAS